MTVSSTTSSIIYVGDGLTTEFDVPFRFLEDSDLQLSIQATDGTVTNLVLNSDYTVSGANEDNGGKVYLVNPVADQAKLSILRIMDMLQETDYRENERFPAESHERALDKLTFEAQQLQAQLDRAITVDVFSDVDPDVLRQHIERVWESCDNIDTVADDITNVDTVSSNISDVNTTATNIADINTNAENITSINTNASNITDITTTASHISAVETVSDNITDVSNVSNSIGNVNTVANDISNVNTVSSNIVDVNTVAGISTDVSAVADISTQIDAVADNKTNIDTVAGISSDVTTVAGISGDVTSVSGISSDVTSVAGNATNINTVAGISSKVSTVAAISSDVTEVAGIRMDVQTVSFNSSAVTTAATNIAAIQAAPTAASNAATSANNASIWSEGTDAQVQALGGVHSSKVWAEVSAAGQIQSDWNQADNTKKDYIKNKPFIPTQAGDIGAVEANAGITGTTKCKITYDAKGLVTAGADLEETDIPTLHLAKVTDVTATATELNYVTGVTSAIQTQIDGKADKDLSNLTTTGEAHFANPALTNSPYTTNRILEIPQNIKLELNNGTLTLKAGSKLYDGLGGEHIVPSDMSFSTATGSATNQVMLIKTDFSTALFSANNDPDLSYNSTTGLVEYTGLGSYYLPVGITIHSGSTYTGIYQIFNGFGYVCSIVFALPGVKVQIPNGRNVDGTYNYLLKETTSVITKSVSGSGFNQYIMINSNGGLAGPTDHVKYDSELNSYIYTDDNSKQSWCIFAGLNFESGKITSFEPYTVDSVLNSNLSNLSAAGEAVIDARATSVFDAKMVVVSALPANPDADTFYFIPD